jgi:hypothetical protein
VIADSKAENASSKRSLSTTMVSASPMAERIPIGRESIKENRMLGVDRVAPLFSLREVHGAPEIDGSSLAKGERCSSSMRTPVRYKKSLNKTSQEALLWMEYEVLEGGNVEKT